MFDERLFDTLALKSDTSSTSSNMCLNRGRLAARLVMSKTITDHRHLFRALDAPGPEGRPAGRSQDMSTTAEQGASPTPTPHAGTGGSEASGAAAVTEAVSGLDKRARAVYEAVRGSIATHGYPPSLREIGEQVGLTSPSSVKHQLDKLERLGLVRRDPHRPRAMEVVATDSSPRGRTGSSGGTAHVSSVDSPNIPGVEDGDAVAVPLVGRIAAGTPILAEQDITDVMALPRRLTGEGELFMLEVHGGLDDRGRHLRRRLGGGALPARRGQR